MLVAQSCPTLCDLMDCNPPGSSVHGILQARILEWVAVSFSRGSSQLGVCTRVSCIAGGVYHLSHFCVSCWLGRVFMLRGLSPFAVMGEGAAL